MNQKKECNTEVMDLLKPYLDEQVLESVFEAKQKGIKDLVIYLENDYIYQLEREEILNDPETPSDLKLVVSTPSSETSEFGVEIPGYVHFWFIVAISDSRIAAMACSIIPESSGSMLN